MGAGRLAIERRNSIAVLADAGEGIVRELLDLLERVGAGVADLLQLVGDIFGAFERYPVNDLVISHFS